MKDNKLWKVFSNYIRLRDANGEGYCTCITCGFTANWKRFDCGHGIPRQHQSTKYNEQNNHAQCKKCNGFEGGKREVYKEEVDKRYGSGTWSRLEILSRTTCKRGQFEIDVLTEHYKKLVAEMKASKDLK